MFPSPFPDNLKSANESPMVSVAIGIFGVRVDVFVDAFCEIFEPLKEICEVAADSTELNAHHLFVFYSHELNHHLRAFLWEFDYPAIKFDINGLLHSI